MFHVSTRLAALMPTLMPALMPALVAAAGVGLLAGCSTTGSAPEPQATAQAQAQPADDRQTLTGSRIPRKNTDRLLKQVGQAGAAEMERSRPPESGPKVN